MQHKTEVDRLRESFARVKPFPVEEVFVTERDGIGGAERRAARRERRRRLLRRLTHFGRA